MAVEVFGRIAPEFQSLMDSLASAASTRDSAWRMPAVGWRRKWEQQLPVTVQRAIARSFMDAMGSELAGPRGFKT